MLEGGNGSDVVGQLEALGVSVGLAPHSSCECKCCVVGEGWI